MILTFAGELTKMIDAGLGRETVAPDTSVAVGRYSEYVEVSDAALATFDTNAALSLRALSVNIEPIQEGTGDPSPENVRPITGRSEVVVWRYGINVWDEEWEVGEINSTTGENVSATKRIRTKGYIRVLPSASYYITTANIQWVCLYDRFQNYIGIATTTPSGTGGIIQTTADTAYMRVSFNNAYGNTYNNDISINYPSTDHDYHAHDIASITEQLGQTVYGGTVDAVSGVMTVEWENIASYDGEALPGEWISDRDVYAPGTTPTTGAQVCYKLATPVTIQLTPQQLETLIGTNNVWSDGGNVSLTYTKYNYTEGY